MEIHISVPFVGYKRTAADEKQKDRMREWERNLKYACDLEMVTQGHPQFADDVSVTIEVNFPAGKRPYDIDRIGNWILDSLKGVVVQDDAQVKELYIRITGTPTSEHTTVKVMSFQA